MDIIACIDNHNGMLFNNRRQSRDRKVFEDISGYLKGKLLVTDFSASMAASAGLPYEVTDISELSAGRSCYNIYNPLFVENISVKELLPFVNRVILYKWNRDYPADFFFDADLTGEGFLLIHTVDFAGFSHEKITREIYER